MTTTWLSVSVPAGTATGGEGGTQGTVVSASDPGSATAQTNLATFLSDYDAVGAAIVVISGDTYSATTHKFTNGGATGLTSAQLHTQTTALNAALTAYLLGKTANDGAVTALAQSGSLLLGYDAALSTNQIKSALRALIKNLGN